MYVKDYCEYLINDKAMSQNSVDAYRRDMVELEKFVESKGLRGLEEVSSTEIMAYLMALREEAKSPATINRKLASARKFFGYLQEKKIVNKNPTVGIRSPKIERKEINYLTIDEIDKLLEIPDDSLKGKRDKAILEAMYATGLRANETIEANLNDVNLRIGFITFHGNHGKARIVPIGRPSREALEIYIYDVRKELIKNEEEKALFVNIQGERLTRQGLWKILKSYGEKAGIEKNMTPNILRNSFAIHMLQNGADLKSIQELLGHEDLATTKAYLSFIKNKIKDVYDSSHPRA